MKIVFNISGTCFSRYWECVPRVGDFVFMDKSRCKVLFVYWGDHVNGKGEPILDKPFVEVILEVVSKQIEEE
jgi:hypothetical protein